MKKFYLLGLLAAGLAVNAQTQKQPAVSNQGVKATKTNHDITPASPVVNPAAGTKVGSTGKGLGKNSHWTVVGQTEFDRPTNASSYRRIIAYPDGKITVIWPASSDGPTTSYLQRGTGYNHFNGTSWGAVTKNRIEAVRTGYPNLDYDAVGGSEIVLSHKATATNSGGLQYLRNGSIGGTNWTALDILDTTPASLAGVLWPRSVVSGDYLHIFASFTDSSASQPGRVILGGVRTPQVYSRYNMRTNTFDAKNQLLPGYDSVRYYSGGGDNYAIDAKGSDIAILLGGLFDDLAIWKSADNGASWTKTVLDSFPVPRFDFKRAVRNEITGELDTPFTTDGALTVRLDNSGKAHCFWAVTKVSDKDSTDQSFFSYPGQQQIAYWYEGRPDSIVSVGKPVEDPNDDDEVLTIGSIIEDRAQYASLGITTAPYAVMSGDTIYVAYQTRTDNDVDGQGIGFTDIYVVSSVDNGATWSEPLNLTSMIGSGTEQIFPSIAADCRTKLHITFTSSEVQGFFDATDNPGKTGPYNVLYYDIPVSDVLSRTLTGVKEVNNLFSLNQNFPNPFNGTTTVPVKLNRASDVTISIVNIIGQTVYSNKFTNNAAGTNNFELNLNAKPGVYFYTVEAGDFKETRKMIVE
ncbi:MAG: T9SS type A sorting domain-containing protein [Bacteroidota bacterium]